jgi:hypothetical protein
MNEILKKLVEELEDTSKEIVSIDTALSGKNDKAIFQKWIEIFSLMTPFNIKQGTSLIASSFRMTKRDEVILLAYIKFFESKLSKMKEDADYMGAMMRHGKDAIEIIDDRDDAGRGMFG